MEELKTAGNAAFAAGRFAESVDAFTEAISVDSSNHILFSNRSASYASLKQWDAALADAERAIQLQPDWAKGYGRKGAALLGLGRRLEARAAYEEGLARDPTNAQLQRGMEATLGALEAARELPQAGATPVENPFGDPAMLARMQSDPKMQEHLKDPQFVAILEELKRDPRTLTRYIKDQRVMQAFMTMLGVQDTHVPATRTAEGEGGADSDEPKGAPKVTEEEQERRQQAEAALREKEAGNEAYKRRDFEAALKHYDAAIALDPSNLALLTNKSAVYFEQGCWAESIALCQETVQRGRETYADFKLLAKALGRIGSCHERQGNLPLAIEFYQKSLTEHRTPDILSRLREAERSLESQQKAAYHNPQLAEEARQAGNELFKAGDYAGALKHYTEAIRRDESDPRGYSNRAACYTKLAAVPEGLKDCDKAIALDASFVKAYIRKATLLHLRRDYTQALETLEQASAHDTTHAHTGEIQSMVARCYTDIRRGEEGGTPDQEETLRRAAQNPEIREILQDPVMAQILQQMQTDPRAAQEHLKNPQVAAKIRKLIAAGIIRTN